jgi:hypothetical protein
MRRPSHVVGQNEIGRVTEKDINVTSGDCRNADIEPLGTYCTHFVAWGVPACLYYEKLISNLQQIQCGTALLAYTFAPSKVQPAHRHFWVCENVITFPGDREIVAPQRALHVSQLGRLP